MFDLKPTETGPAIARFFAKASESIVENLDDANDAQKVILGQQNAVLQVAAGAAITLGGVVVGKYLSDDKVIASDDDQDDVIDINSAG